MTEGLLSGLIPMVPIIVKSLTQTIMGAIIWYLEVTQSQLLYLPSIGDLLPAMNSPYLPYKAKQLIICCKNLRYQPANNYTVAGLYPSDSASPAQEQVYPGTNSSCTAFIASETPINTSFITFWGPHFLVYSFQPFHHSYLHDTGQQQPLPLWSPPDHFSQSQSAGQGVHGYYLTRVFLQSPTRLQTPSCCSASHELI